MRIVFFEVQKWEREKLQYSFPDALLVDAKLSGENVATETFESVEILSPFIYSTLQKDVIDALPNLKCIATRSTGFDHIDTDYCKQKGICITNVPEYGSDTVAEHTFALILSLTRKIYQSVNQSKNLNFDHDKIRGVDLAGKTIGIVGLGKIGQKILSIAKGFGMKSLAYNRTQRPELLQQFDFRYVSLPQLLQNSDIVTLHLPLNPETYHIVNKENIVQFKKGSYLINTARGGLIETEAVVTALEQGILAGVGLDVLEEELELGEEAAILTSEYKKKVDLKNLIFDHILINHPKVLITPHNAFNSNEALQRIIDTTIVNIKAFLEGKPVNIV